MGITPVINNKKNTVEPMFTFSSSSAAASASSCASNSVPGTASATSCSSSSSSSSGRCYQRGKPTSSTMTGRPEVAQQHSQRSSRDVCNCCKVKFSSSVLNLILKKTCPSCQKLVCPSCLVFTLKIPKSLCMCKKCAKLMTFNFEPRHLMRLHGKELREILSAMDIPYVDGSEKSELVQLILRHRGGDIWTPSHPEPPLGRTTNNAATNQQQVPSPLRSEENIPSAPPIEEEEAAAAEEVQDEKGSTRPSEEGGRREEDDDDEEFVFVPPFAPREPPPPPPPREPPSPPPPPPPRFKPPSSSTPSSPRNRPEINLNEILSETEIEGLTIRELKSILLKNSVDYKGCCEKYELAARVTQLWHSAKKSNVDVETLSEDEICKICMNAPIDCVMLECGHMATCTRCGRQMNECPICRQYVVRVVRTFRA